MFNTGKTLFIVAGLLSFLGACAQSRVSTAANNKTDEIWSAQELCSNSAAPDILGCFDLTPNITQNSMTISVKQLGFNAGQIPYRVLARYDGDSLFQLLKDKVTVSAGGTITVKPKKAGQFIENFVEWRIELSSYFYRVDEAGQIIEGDGTYLIQLPKAGMGWPAAQALIDYPELFTESDDLSNQ